MEGKKTYCNQRADKIEKKTDSRVNVNLLIRTGFPMTIGQKPVLLAVTYSKKEIA